MKAPELSMPKGGGAIRGVGEKFAANPVTGSASFSLPLPATPGRAGFGPQLALSYDSASGNGPFGFGWSLGLSSITRKTDKGLPRYRDGVDTFIISGAEDLVPVLDANGEPLEDRVSATGYLIHRYCPRIEGAFARIERWTNVETGDAHWRTISSDNVLSVYGKDESSRIADPADKSQVFSWLICETRDDKGNAILFDYEAEDGADLDLTPAHEQQRGRADAASRVANRYIARIRYGNARTLLDSTPRRPRFLSETAIKRARWRFELVFDYAAPTGASPDLVGAWSRRADPFSTYRAGFEVRTYRLCHRVLMFHRFPSLSGRKRCLVRSLDLSYRTAPQHSASSDPGYSFLQSARQWSYQRNAGAWHSRPLPPVEFTYSEATVDDHVHEVDAQTLENLPVGLGSGYQWTDLDGEGLSGVLTEQAGAWYYKPNLGVGLSGPRFGALRPVNPQPSMAALNAGRQQLMDVQGNGALDLVDFHPPLAGFHERDDAEGWKQFIPFASLPNIDWNDANLRFVDLTGDGHADALVTEHEVFTWYPSLAARGFGASERSTLPLDERDGPRVVFADGEQAIYLADMSGDGLTDIARIRNGEVCYWPNLGYGRFGKQVVMDGSPWFDHPDQFDQRRIRLADIDGSGTTDLIYLGRDGARLWFNRSGNGWSAPRQLPFPVATSNVGQIQVADLLGNGTACLVWSSDLPGDARRPMRYLDLMGGNKPHLMVQMRNNLGAVTTVDYAASTKFYLRDKAAGRPWITKLPFPVHCVEHVTVTDLHRKTVFANTYSYHHGYFDGIEREFRGFGRVEQVDTQSFQAFAGANASSAFVSADPKLYQPPVKTITWFHTGIATDRTRILGLFEREYFPSRYAARLAVADFVERQLPQPDIEIASGPQLESGEWREAMRACKGMVLRQEVFELDVKDLHANPSRHTPVRLFSAAQHNCHIRRVQPRERNRHAVFLVAESEAVTYHYELSLTGTEGLKPDPRVAHTLNLRFDKYGRALQSVAAVYPRRIAYANPSDEPTQLTAEQIALIRAVQGELHVAYTETEFTEELPDDLDTHRLPAPCAVRTYELTGVFPEDEDDSGTPSPADNRYFAIDELRKFRLNAELDAEEAAPVAPLEYHEQPPDSHKPPPDQAPHRRLVEHAVTLYFAEGLADPLPFRKPSRLGLTYETYKLAITAPLLDAVFASATGQDPFAAEAKTALGASGAGPDFLRSGYQTDPKIFHPGDSSAVVSSWWMRSGVAQFESDAAKHFYLPERFIDPFGNLTRLEYDADDLLVQSSTDALGNTVSVEAFDHRVMAPARLRDANDNISETAFDIRGLPVATALMGKAPTGAASETSDTVTTLSFDALNPSPDAVAQFFQATPLNNTEAGIWLDQARAWLGKATARFIYQFGESDPKNPAAESASGACSIVREEHEVDALNAVVKLQLAFEYSDGAGQAFVKKVQAEPDPAIAGGALRWIANGKTIVNNKGKPVLQYEPYFSSSRHRFEEPVAEGVTAVMFYDAPGRLVRTDMPDGSFTRVEFSPWFSRSFDQNDTVKASSWYRRRRTRTDRQATDGSDAEEQEAQNASTEDERAARLAALHADTPAETHFDSLGREVVAIAHNRVPDEDATPTEPDLAKRVWRSERYMTFTKLDAEGKPLWVCDALGHRVMQYIVPPVSNNRTGPYDPARPHPAYAMPDAAPAYDIAGNLLFQRSMDAGDRRMLMDAAGQPMLAWDENDTAGATSAQPVPEHRRFETLYDALHRPVEQWLRINGGPPALVEAFTYADTDAFKANGVVVDQPGLDAAKARNLIGQATHHYDPSGLATIERVDEGGAAEQITRRLVKDWEASLADWNKADRSLLLEGAGETFIQITEHDALGRMTTLYNWHRDDAGQAGNSSRVAVYVPQYNERGLMDAETLHVGAHKETDAIGRVGFVENADPKKTVAAIKRITWSAKGQKESLELGNDTITRYSYDRETFRLTHLYTRRTKPAFVPDCATNAVAAEPARPCGVQNLHYTYDAVGNVTHIRDDAQQTIYFANAKVEPSSAYVYDALYRLIEAEGRENAAVGAPPHPEGDYPRGSFPSPDATRRYAQRYSYDPVGNMISIAHRSPPVAGGPPGSWTRHYDYAFDDPAVPAIPASNRLWKTSVGADVTSYTHDLHGNMLNLAAAKPGKNVRWDWRDMIRHIDLVGGGHAHYNYGIDKQRTRKFIQRKGAGANAGGSEDRIYLPGYELFRRRKPAPSREVIEEIESLHLFEGEQRVLLVDDVLVEETPAPTDRPKVKAQTLFRYQYGNHLGSVGVELDQAAKQISYEEYHPYGTPAFRLIDSLLEAPAKRYRYTGMERDEESGLNYHAARYYAPRLGRWCSCDPIGGFDQRNVYRYASSSPLNRVDSDGRSDRPPSMKLFDTTNGAWTVPRDWKPPDLNSPEVYPMSHADFSYRKGLYDQDAWRRSQAAGSSRPYLRPLIDMTRDIDIEESARPYKGMMLYDTKRVFNNGQRDRTNNFVMQEGVWHVVAEWKELSGKRASLASDAPLLPPSMDDALRSDHLFNFDKSARENPIKAILPPVQKVVADIRQAARLDFEASRLGVNQYVGLQAGISSLAVDINPTGNIKSDTSGARKHFDHIGLATGNLTGTISLFEPGLSAGYTFLNRSLSHTTVLTVGMSPFHARSEFLPRGVSPGSLPFPVPGAAPKAKSPFSPYVGARLSFSW